MRPVRQLQNLKLPRPPAVLGEGALAPVFAMPEGFSLRLGARFYDPFFSGTYTSGGRKIGFIRIPDFYGSPSLFEQEIQFFQNNTDGLVIDITRNPGGNACIAEELLARLTPSFFQVVLQEIRVTWSSLLEVQYYLEEAREYGDPAEIEQMEAMAKAFEFAYRENNGRTMPIPICGVSGTRAPARDQGGKPIGYTKPLLVLTDEMTASSGDLFAAMIQDNMRGPLFGMRTMGAGGSPAAFDAGIYSEGSARVSRSQVRRKDPMVTPEYPTTPYLENVGVRPDIEVDYMTKENLVNTGKPFVDAFTAKIVELIGQ
jgi:C-terminal processing protease CtpA/Prc